MQVYRAIKYIRLSYTDDKSTESDSVVNQRKLIDNYIAQHPEIEVVDEKIDDGYSGVLFDRPAFQEMMELIKEGKANCVIVKDLSRLGREYIETGRYAMVMAKLNLTNTRIGLMLVYLSFSVPYAVWMLVGFFKTVPIGIEEAARIDGANKLQVFVRIVLPLVSPGIVATAIYVFINAWNEYLYSMILMSSSDKTTISVAVKTLEGADILNWGSLMAACAIVVVPSIIFFCFIQNKMAGGLSDGAVK